MPHLVLYLSGYYAKVKNTWTKKIYILNEKINFSFSSLLDCPLHFHPMSFSRRFYAW